MQERLLEMKDLNKNMDVRLGDGAEPVDLHFYFNQQLKKMGMTMPPPGTAVPPPSAKNDGDIPVMSCRRFASSFKELQVISPQDAALGVLHYMHASPAVVNAGKARGVREIQAEFESFVLVVQEPLEGPRPWWATLEVAEEAEECMKYCLFEAAGSSDLVFENSPYRRDCDADGLRTDRTTSSGNGMRLRDFCALPQARAARLETAHVVALRIYSEAAFKLINGPLREPWGGRPHPLPVTVSFLREAISKLRAIEANSPQAHFDLDLWRGMSDLQVGEDFMEGHRGGTEPAPMSTTSSLQVAAQYSQSDEALLLKVRTSGFMDRGVPIRFLSAFPAENEYLYPPLTYLKPTGKQARVMFFDNPADSVHAASARSAVSTMRVWNVVEVVPHYADE